jgi:hypothetical protein
VAGLVNISPLKGRTGLATGLCKGAWCRILLATVFSTTRVLFLHATTTSSASYLVHVSVIEVLWPDLSIFLREEEGQALRPDFANRLSTR